MNLKLWKWIAAIAALTAVLPAQAQMWQRHRPQQAAEEERRPERQRMREGVVEEGQRQELQQAVRMSPEERRQLRRDIHEAGRELYRRRGERSSE